MKNVSKRFMIALHGLLLANIVRFPFLNEPYDTILDIVGIALALASLVLMICELVHDHKVKKQAEQDAQNE